MIINHNLSALNAWRALSINATNTQKSLEKLSSGYRINRAADDAAGLAISEKMRAQIRGLNQALRNAQDGISLIQTAEGALNETHAILQRIRELAVQAANDTNTNKDRFELQKEVNQLVEEITRIGNNTEFNTMKLLDGSFTGVFHIGANEGQNLTLKVNDMRAEALNVVATSAVMTYEITGTNATKVSASNLDNLKGGAYTVEVAANGTVTLKDEAGTTVATATLTDNGTSVTLSITNANYLVDGTTQVDLTIDISDTDTTTAVATEAGTISIYVLEKGKGISIMDQDDASRAITEIQRALDRVSSERSKLGAYQNRLEHTINNLSVAAENLTAAESRIRDVDMAQAMMEFTKNNILNQAATAMLAQANQLPQTILQLLR
ncbi:flagellin [Caldanaerobacter subterraneus subsp. yonseiensis KB-1]|uniref:Flagellin n=1 Tax=Caldanaerobacter subterraneus subsp. yonseiensis KB-1 TaxID=1388761 RepID=U5CPR5_CALSX|nr:flagellin [Caldanaerobacter subterraneus]ERM91769.1 flagellin [Caldanaerobacter subterraneus subsp. yonseiensis KB-1]